MTAAFAGSQLRKIDKLNDMRIKNCHRLTQRLRSLKGIQPPYVPEGCKHTYHMYRARFQPKELGIEMPHSEFKEKVKTCLEAEGVRCGQWIDAQAGPNFPLFQLKEGYGNGCPWKCHNRDISYNMEEYPQTKKFIEASTQIIDLPIARSIQVVDTIADAFEKIWENMNEVLDIEL